MFVRIYADPFTVHVYFAQLTGEANSSVEPDFKVGRKGSV